MLSDAERACYYQSLGLDQYQIARTERMRLSSPARKVGAVALKNTVVQFWSKLNRSSRELESHTVETLCALELEMFSNSLEYFVQVRVDGVERMINDKRYVHSATIDIMAFKPTAIVFVDCRCQEAIDLKSKEKPYDWIREGATWIHRPYKEWAEHRGYAFETWIPPRPASLYLANLMVLYAFKGEPLLDGEKRAAQTLQNRVMQKPLSILDALSSIHGLTLRTISILLASGWVFGTLQSRPLSETDRFFLFGDKQRCAEADSQWLATLEASLDRPVVDNAILCATKTDHDAAKERLARVTRMLEGTEQVTRRYRKFTDAVLACQRKGSSPLQACLTQYSRCGRRTTQLEPDQLRAMQEVVRKYWNTGAVKFKNDLHHHLDTECKNRSVATPSATTLGTFLRRRSSLAHALATGGRKAFHALEDPVDPVYATIPALVPGLHMHVDSTKFDDRMSTELIRSLPFACPTLYLAIDSCSPEPMGRAILFGDACRDMLMILMRDILFRHGVLPRYVSGDRGCDLSSDVFREFCGAVGITILTSPTSDPRKNGPAENGLGRVNLLLAQRLLGSTEPDKQGRKVDNRFKSYRTACHLFKTIVEEVDTCLFEDLANTPTGNSTGSPREIAEVVGGAFGNVGVAIPNDENFRILTSIPLTRDISVVGTQGYRHEHRMYRSAKLSEMLKIATPIEKRRDCVDPTLLYFKFGDSWVSASSRDSVVMRTRGDLEQLFSTMMGRRVRSENARIRNDIARARLNRIERANASAAATAHLRLPAPLAERDPSADFDVTPFGDLSGLTPFDEEDLQCPTT
jgi:putative transposase